MLRGHQVDHVQKIGWKNKKDLSLLPDLAKRGYDALVTADLNQLQNEDEAKLIKRYGFHHVRFQQVGKGIAATASAMATIMAGLPAVIPELEKADGQRLVLLKLVKCNQAQYELTDPRVNPPTYWPGRGTRNGSPATPRQRPAAHTAPVPLAEEQNPS
jgi:hypothetical protein